MRIVVLHAGGLGDLILVETLLAALRDRHPGARLELVCRAGPAPAVALHGSPPDEVHTFEFDPYRWAVPDEAAARDARALLPHLRGDRVALFVSAELRATWLSEILAAALAPERAIISDAELRAPSDVGILLATLGLDRNRAVDRLPAPAVPEHELRRYARLAGETEPRLPRLRPLAGAPTTELAVFPLSATAFNRWPLSRVAESARRIAAAHGLTPVVIGSVTERALLDAAAAEGAFGPNARVAVGSRDDLAATAARIAAAAGYVGVDTGLAHLAAAYGRPGVTVYGGGYWPHHAPWGPRSAGVVAPIPCFGCGWDCAFERPFCLDGIDVTSVAETFDAAYAGEGVPVLRELTPYGAREHEIFAAASHVHRAAQRDRAARLTAITRLRNVLARYARRMNARRRRSHLQLASLARTTGGAAKRLERARQGSLGDAPIPHDGPPLDALTP
ncbi:MAG TPA: glycosyltransferase family 9 protein [Candidatus Elarobacter sp.]